MASAGRFARTNASPRATRSAGSLGFRRMASLHAFTSACATQRVESRFAVAAAALVGDGASSDHAAMGRNRYAKTNSLAVHVDSSVPLLRIPCVMAQRL